MATWKQNAILSVDFLLTTSNDDADRAYDCILFSRSFVLSPSVSLIHYYTCVGLSLLVSVTQHFCETSADSYSGPC
jgi:hypothetical protein